MVPAVIETLQMEAEIRVGYADVSRALVFPSWSPQSQGLPLDLEVGRLPEIFWRSA